MHILFLECGARLILFTYNFIRLCVHSAVLYTSTIYKGDSCAYHYAETYNSTQCVVVY